MNKILMLSLISLTFNQFSYAAEGYESLNRLATLKANVTVADAAIDRLGSALVNEANNEELIADCTKRLNEECREFQYVLKTKGKNYVIYEYDRVNESKPITVNTDHLIYSLAEKGYKQQVGWKAKYMELHKPTEFFVTSKLLIGAIQWGLAPLAIFMPVTATVDLGVLPFQGLHYLVRNSILETRIKRMERLRDESEAGTVKAIPSDRFEKLLDVLTPVIDHHISEKMLDAMRTFQGHYKLISGDQDCAKRFQVQVTKTKPEHKSVIEISNDALAISNRISYGFDDEKIVSSTELGSLSSSGANFKKIDEQTFLLREDNYGHPIACKYKKKLK